MLNSRKNTQKQKGKRTWLFLLALTCMFFTSTKAQSGDVFFKGSVVDHCNSSAAGDIDGDGVDELIVGSISSGKVFVFKNTVLIHTLLAPTSSEKFGTSLFISDLNNDGAAEILVGAPQDNGGRVYIYDGITFLLMNTIQAPFSGPNLPVFPGDFGESISTTPDMNGNGFPEVLVGAPRSADGAFVQRGLVTIVDGDMSLPQMTVLQNFSPAGVGNAAAMARFGLQVEGGDFDGDGVGDVAVYWHSLSWVIAAGGSIPGTIFGEPNDDAHLEQDVSNPLTINPYKPHVVTVYRLENGLFPLHVITSRLDDISLTPFAGQAPKLDMANAKDLDGDGADDLLVGDSIYRIYMGGPTRYGKAILWLPKYANGNVDDSKGALANNTVGGKRLGRAVAALGDINGDGYADTVSVSTAGIQLNSGGLHTDWQLASDMGEVQPAYAGTYASTSNLHYDSRLESGDFDGDGHPDIAFVYRDEFDATTKIDMYSFFSQSATLSCPVQDIPAQGGKVPLFLNCDAATVGNKVFLVAASHVASRGKILKDPCDAGLFLPFNTTDNNVVLSLAQPNLFFSVNDMTVPSDSKLISWMDWPPGSFMAQDISVAFFTYDHLHPNQCWTAASNVHTFHLND